MPSVSCYLVAQCLVLKRASDDSTKDAGPNGSLEWLNCGINDAGWNPQQMTMDDIISSDLAWAVQQDNSPFKACKEYVWAFTQYGEQYGSS